MSQKFSLNKTDLKSLFRGLVITLCGAFLTYVAENVGKVDFGTYTPFVVAIIALGVNTGRKFISGK